MSMKYIGLKWRQFVLAHKSLLRRVRASVIALSIICITLVLGFYFGTPESATEPKREPVYNSAWDSSVWQVESWLKKNLKDPDSLEVVRWYPVHKIGDGFAVQVNYRAHNSFGGINVETRLFQLDNKGNVYRSTPIR